MSQTLHRSRLLFLSALLATAAGVLVVAAKAQEAAAAKPATQPATQPSKPVNKFCPVEPDHEIDPSVTVTHDGKVIGLCCRDCIKDFEKDPKKYSKNLK